MATYTVTGAVAGIPVGHKAQVIEVVLDFSTTALATGEDIDVFEIPANTLVLNAGIEVLTVASTGSPTLDLGDGTAADTWVTDVAGHTAVGFEIGSTPIMYSAADNIDMKAITADFDGKVRVFATVVPMGAAETAAAFA